MFGRSPSVVLNTLRYNPQLCINCGMCLAVCPHAVFGPGQDVVSLVNPDACMECGACQRNCPTDAIAVESGVGCAAAMIRAALTGSGVVTCGDSGCCGSAEATQPSCGCESDAQPSASGGSAPAPTSDGSCCGGNTKSSCCG